jgi:hypothetical protein
VHHASTHQARRTTHRSLQPTISPYFVEEIGWTIADIQRARAADFDSASVAG